MHTDNGGRVMEFGIEIAHFGIDFRKQNLGRTLNKQYVTHLLINNPKMFNGETDDLAIKLCIPH